MLVHGSCTGHLLESKSTQQHAARWSGSDVRPRPVALHSATPNLFRQRRHGRPVDPGNRSEVRTGVSVTHRFGAKRDSCNHTLQGESFVSKPVCMDAYNREFVRLMGEAGWTATDRVNRLGLSKGAISQYRNGITRPSLQVLRLFASLSGVQLTLPGETPPPDPLTSVSDQERRILLTLRRIPSDQRIAIAAMLTAVAGPAPVDEHTADETVKVVSAATELLEAAVAVQTSESEPASGGDASKPPVQRRSGAGKSDRNERRIRSV